MCDPKILSASLPSQEPHLLGKFLLCCIQLLKIIRVKQIKSSHSPNTRSKVLFHLVYQGPKCFKEQYRLLIQKKKDGNLKNFEIYKLSVH